MPKHWQRFCSRFTVAAAGLIALVATAWILTVLPFRSRDARPPVAPSPPAPEVAPRERPWPIEHLDELGFDRALTLLASEASGGLPALPRVEAIASRLCAMHEENLRKIAAAAAYYRGLGEAAWQRFAGFEAEYQRRFAALELALEKLRAGDPIAGRRIADLVRESGAHDPPRLLPKAEDLPRRSLPAKPLEPRLDEEAWQAGKPVGKALESSALNLLGEVLGLRTAAAQEVDPDLAETLEVRFTAESAPEIQKLLDDEGLRGSPARIAIWVRNHIEFVPIWGALQSSVTCLENKKGTAMDIASLTIALLRASGIRARYQAGTVRLPIAEAKNWLGNFESAIAASSLLQSGGIPAAVQVDGSGQPVALRFEHVWVRAYVDYIPYQGACHLEGDTWVDIDVSIKLHDYLELPDPQTYLGDGAAEDIVRAYFAPVVADSASGAVSFPDLGALRTAFDQLEAVGARIGEDLESARGPILAREALGLGKVRLSTSPVLSGTPAFEIVAQGWEQVELSDHHAFAIDIALEAHGTTLLSQRLRAAALGSSRFAVQFLPEAGIDSEILAGQLPPTLEERLPDAVLTAGVRLVPYLSRDGLSIATGAAVPMGSRLELIVDYQEPAISTPSVRKEIVAGEATAIGLDLVSVPASLFEKALDDVERADEWLESNDTASAVGFDPSRFAASMLSLVVHLWFAQMDTINSRTGGGADCPTHRYPSVGFCSDRWIPDSLFGLPLALVPEGLTVDIPGDVTLLLSRKADVQEMASVNILQGFIGSGLEAFVPMQVINVHADPRHHSYWLGSTLSLQVAWRTGGSIVAITQENADAAIPRLSLPAADLLEVRDAVDRGLTVITALDAVTSGRQCLAGYILLDPATGNGIYRMSGGLCGGSPLNCALEVGPQSHFNTLIKGHISAISAWGKAAVGYVEAQLRKNWTGLGLQVAFASLLQYADTWVAGYKSGNELPASIAQAVEATVYLHAHRVLAAAVDRLLCIVKDADGNCVQRDTSLHWSTGLAYESIMRWLRSTATLKAAEVGLAVPCGCFCTSECGDSNVFDFTKFCSE